MTMTGAQLRAARGLIDLSQLELAVMLQVGLQAVAEFESGQPTLPQEVLVAFRRALEAAGVSFAEANRHEPGVRLRTGK